MQLQGSGINSSIIDRIQNMFLMAHGADEDDDDEEPFIDPLPLINPPDGCLEKTRLTIDYQKLPNTHSIRLLNLKLPPSVQPGVSGQISQAIECSVSIVDLDTKPDYFALSYTWGDPRTIYTNKEDIFDWKYWAAAAFEITVDGKPVAVGTNLYTALTGILAKYSTKDFPDGLAAGFEPQEPDCLYIWIDALCINQDDVTEKSSQVAMMDRIYRQARSTIMWLGGGERMITRDANAAISKFENVIDHFKKQVGNDEMELWARCAAIDLTEDESFEDLGLEAITHEELVGWYLLFSRTWFTRSWVVQEWVLSRNCLFLCGSIAVHPKMLWEQLNISVHSGWRGQIRALVASITQNPDAKEAPVDENLYSLKLHTSVGLDSPLGALVSRLPALKTMTGQDSGLSLGGIEKHIPVLGKRIGLGHIVSIENDALEPSKPAEDETKVSIDLFQRALGLKTKITVEDLRDMSATDPRDKVFAFAGLFSDEQGKPEYPAPDYAQSTANVYIEASKVEARLLKGFFLAAAVGLGGENPHSLPTWATDYSQQREGSFLENSHVFSAAEGLPDTRLEFPDDGRRALTLTAHRIATVRCMESNNSSSIIEKVNAQLQVLSLIPETSQIASPPTPEEDFNSVFKPSDNMLPQNRFEVLWRTLAMDNSLRSGEHPLDASHGERHMVHLKGCMAMHTFMVCIKDIPDLIDLGLEKAQGRGEEDEFTEHLIMNGLQKENFANFEMFAQEGTHGSKEAVNRDDEYDKMMEMGAAIAKLEGTIPFDSSERPQPENWIRFELLKQNALDAIEESDYQGCMDSLKEGLDTALGVLLQGDTPSLREMMREMMQQSKVFATANGRLGTGTGDVKEGDEIWLVPGLHAPAALREADQGRYQLVGCVYVHGIMHGEAAPVQEQGMLISLV